MAFPLPTLEQIGAASDKLGSALSDLDWFDSAVAGLEAEAISAEEALRRFRDNVPLPEDPPYEYDAELFARLLVFADEARDDADVLREYASKLRGSLLWLYRRRVIDAEAAKIRPRRGVDA